MPYLKPMSLEACVVVLVVDDDADIRALLCEVLVDAFACVVVDAGDGLEALQSLRVLLPDLIVLDWMMPNASGSDVLAAMSKDSCLARIPVMVCSGSDVCAPASVPVVHKPVDPDEIVKVARNLLATHLRPRTRVSKSTVPPPAVAVKQ